MSRSARYAIDRIEGDGTSATVVLVADADGAVIDVPRTVLGRAAVEGAVLRVHLLADGTPDWTTVERDAAEEEHAVIHLERVLPEIRVGRDDVAAEHRGGAGAGETRERGGYAERFVDEVEDDPAEDSDAGAHRVGVPARAAQEPG